MKKEIGVTFDDPGPELTFDIIISAAKL